MDGRNGWRLCTFIPLHVQIEKRTMRSKQFYFSYGFRWGQDGKSWQCYPVTASVLQNSIFGPTFFLPYTDLLDDVIYNIVKSVREIVTRMAARHNLPLRDELNKETFFLLQESQDLEVFSWKYEKIKKIAWIAISITFLRGQWN